MFETILFQSAKKEVYFFYCKECPPEQAFKRGFMPEAYRKMQSELLFHGYVLRYEQAEQFAPLARKWAKSGIHPHALFFFRMRASWFESLAAGLEKYCDRIQKMPNAKPRIVMHWGRSKYSPFSRSVAVFHEGHPSTSAARLLAQFLITHNYRAPIFFAEADDTIWQSRWIWILLKMRAELKERDSGFKTRFIVQAPKPGNAEENSRSSYLDTLLNDYNDMFWVEKDNPRHALAVVKKEIRVAERFERAFGSAKSGDIWIFARDSEAASALEWAQKKGIKVPQQLSILGLEDDPTYYPFGISCCVPDWERIGYLLAHAIIGDIPVQKTAKGFIAAQARMLERLTTK
jgi:hypothetical protein